MSADLAPEQIRQFVERIMRLKDEVDAIAADVRDVYAEAKALGFDKTALGVLVTYSRPDAGASEILGDRAMEPGRETAGIAEPEQGAAGNVDRGRGAYGVTAGETAPYSASGPSEALPGRSPQLPAASTGVAGSFGGWPELPDFLRRSSGAHVAHLLSLPSTMREGASAE